MVRVDDEPSNTFIGSMAETDVDVDVSPYHRAGHERVVMRVAPTHPTTIG